MELREFTPTTLRQAIRSPEFWSTQHIPITPYRGLSHIHNPRAEADDVILLVGYEEGDVTAYVGILPDRLIVDGTPHKVGWFTAWWVDPACGKRGVGRGLLARAMELYDGRIAMSSMTEPATRLVDSLGNHRTLRLARGLHVHYRPRGRSTGGFVRPLFRALDPFLVRLMRRRLTTRQHLRQAGAGIEVEYAREIDAEAAAFMDAHRGRELTQRGPEELNWILRYPWVISGPIGDRLEKKYFFSSVARRFELFGLKIYEHGTMIGFLLLKVRDDALSVPYSYFDPRHAAQVLHVILRHVVGLRITALFLHDAHIVGAFQESGAPCFGKEEAVRRSFISKAFDELDLDGYVLQDGDGDTVFT